MNFMQAKTTDMASTRPPSEAIFAFDLNIIPERCIRHMNKCYKYSKVNVICDYLGYFLIGFVGLGLIFLYVLGVPKTINEWMVFGLGYSPFLLMLLLVIIWMVSTLKIRIFLNDNGLQYSSMFKTVEIAWKDIESIQKKYFYSGGYPSYGPPIDLEIKTKDNKKLKIFYFVTNCEPQEFDLSRASDEGMKDFESEIKKQTNIEF